MLGAVHTARVFPTPWTSLKIPIICSSLNRLLFIGSAPSKGAELHFSTVLFQGGRPVLPTDVLHGRLGMAALRARAGLQGVMLALFVSIPIIYEPFNFAIIFGALDINNP